MKTHVEFRSNLFPPYEGEEEEVNPGLFGKRLAEFLARKLDEVGFETKDLFCEDWGWGIPVKNPDFHLWIGCGHQFGNDDEFLCFIEPHKPVIRKFFKKVDTTRRVGSLQEAIDKILHSTSDIRNIKWWTHDEFNVSMSGREPEGESASPTGS